LTRWMSEPPRRVASLATKAERRPDRAWSVGGSILVHVLLLVVVVAGELRNVGTTPEPPERIPLVLVDSPPTPPPPRIETPVIPAPKFQPPPPRGGDEEKPLLGFESHGPIPGVPLRPPGAGEMLGPEESSGPKGEGMKGGEDGALAPSESPGGSAPFENRPAPEPTPPSGPPESWPGGTRPRAEWNPFPDRRSIGPDRPGAGGPGRPGAPGTGDDYDVGVGGGFYGDLQFESGDFDWSDYSRKVYFAVRRAWLRELYARVPRFGRDQTLLGLRDLDGEVVIQFILARDGSVQELEIVRPSPMPSLDDGSSAALRRAVLPPLPDDFPRDRERVAFLFRLSGFESSHQLQRQLEYSQSRGEF